MIVQLPPPVPGFTVPSSGPVQSTTTDEAPRWVLLGDDSPLSKTRAATIQIGGRYHVVFHGSLQWAPHYPDPLAAAQRLVDLIRHRASKEG